MTSTSDSPRGGGFYTAPPSTSLDLAGAAVLRCRAVPRGEAVVGNAPAGVTSTLTERTFELADCTALRGAAPAAGATLVGYTMLTAAQRSAEPGGPTLSFDSQRFFGMPVDAAGVAVLLIVGGPAVTPAMGFEGKTPELRTGGSGTTVRAIALVGVDAALETASTAMLGWSADESPAAVQRALEAGHPLAGLDALRVTLARRDLAGAAAAVAQALQADGAVALAVRDAIKYGLRSDDQGPDAQRLRDRAK